MGRAFGLRKSRGLTLQDALTIAMLVWIGISVIALLIDIGVVMYNISKGNYNVTIPIRVGVSLPLTG